MAERIGAIRERIEKAALRAGRKPETVRLMGVSKFHSEEAVREAIRAGLLLFGENRVQEAAAKFPPLTAEGIELHLIGSLQRNKAKQAALLFDGIQSLDRDELVPALEKAAAERTAALPVRTAALPVRTTALPVLLELRTGEASKSGYADEDTLSRGAELVLAAPSLKLTGLMTMAPFTGDEKAVRKSFRALVHARDTLQKRFPALDLSCLSMGMSGDFEIAVEEGSTLVRIGQAIFGDRT